MKVIKTYLLLGFAIFLFVSCKDSSLGTTADDLIGRDTQTAVVNVTSLTGRVWKCRYGRVIA